MEMASQVTFHGAVGESASRSQGQPDSGKVPRTPSPLPGSGGGAVGGQGSGTPMTWPTPREQRLLAPNQVQDMTPHGSHNSA